VRRVIGLVVLALALVTVAGLYFSGPTERFVLCFPKGEQPTNGGSIWRPLSGGACLYQRTNAWERFEGAITGNPER
jgi:hypothetical protein